MGYFPKQFKTGTIKLLPKPNTDHTQPINYRPISLLEVTGKILEKIINKRIIQYLEFNNLLPTTQHGFRRGRGTDTAITIAHETIAHHIANHDQVYVILRDVSKAFDKVWIEGLQFKISQLQFPDIITKLLNNFITERKAKIKINAYTGPEFNLLSGVPQGSSLSPTLYTIYTIDIPEAGPGTTNIQYADDITQIITYPGKSRNLMAIRTVNEINKINNYEKQWKIKTNKQKFKIVPIAVRKKNNIVIEGNLIEYTPSGKILGNTICRNGITKHINEMKAKAKGALIQLYRFKNLPEKIKLHLVKACILPILQYPAIPLVTASQNNILKLQRIQNRALKFVYNEYYPYTRTIRSLHDQSQLEPLNVTLYTRAQNIMEKVTNMEDAKFKEILQNYDINKSHTWFPKTKSKLQRGQPNKIYT